MDIIVKSVLNYIQNQTGHSQSVLAGGAVRDTVLELEPKDYDLFVPSKRPKDIIQLVQSIEHEFSVTDLVCKTKFYDKVDNPQKITCVYGFEFEGKKIDVIGIQEEDDGDFPDIVIKDFDYGINMAYHDGNSLVDDNSYFREDSRYGQMTLVNLAGMHDLPNAVMRYNNFNEKFKAARGHGLLFRAPKLMFKEERKVVRKPLSFKKSAYTDEATSIDELDWLPTMNTQPTPIPVTGGGTLGTINTNLFTGNTTTNF